MSSESSGRAAVAEYAPKVAPVLDRLEATAGRGLDVQLVDATRKVVAAVHTHTTRPAFDDADRAALAFAEQFAVDVSSLDDATRTAMLTALGNDAFTYAQTVYVLDVLGRARLVLDQLFGTSAPAPAPAEPFADLWTGIETFLMVVPGLQALDPITTELIRLRLANHHNCRLCKSLRSYSALEAGAGEETFATVTTDTAAALALVDAFAWTPARLDHDLIDRVRVDFDDAQQVEIVLDTARNAANKVAVALGADAPHVSTGYEVYDVAADGTITYGMEHPRVG
jgi:alkylhydroperoxidase family enzyme